MLRKMDHKLIDTLKNKIDELNPGVPINIMEVCGTHTMAIARYGIRQMLPDNIRLISGPGCPVCVTSAHDIDMAIEFSKLPDVILTTFGDMIRVPGTKSKLSVIRARGSDVKVVYSVYDALDMAIANPSKEVIFEAVGFETTAPSVADAIMRARAMGIRNFSVLCMHKTVPNALKALLDIGEVKIDGFLLPGHVSAIIGKEPYEFIAKDYGIGGVISGFEVEDVLLSIASLLVQLRDGPKIENQYKRVVRDEGNVTALKMINKVFRPCDTYWRGIGVIPMSGLMIKTGRCGYEEFDAQKKFEVKVDYSREPAGCKCGEVLRGVIEPEECPLFGKTCNPENPIGPCMVTGEGSCGIWYRERRQRHMV